MCINMTKNFFALLFLSFFSPLLSSNSIAASDSPRMALVVGNGAYASIGVLPNPTADASLIASTLQDLGFETSLALDTDQGEMKRQIADFGRRLRASSKDAIGFFYYAGHGVQADGRNYLLPIDAVPTDKADLDLMGVEANWILRQMESAGNRTNIVVLDACRNNPFVTASRSLSRGLAQIDAPTGSFISYATAPGKVALDGDSVNSPFTTALANALPIPGIPIEQIFKRVRIDVIKATQGRQIPWDSSSLVEEVVMRPSTPIAEVKQPPNKEELALWESVNNSENPDRISMFLQVYPQSALAPKARELLMEALLNPNKPSADHQLASLETLPQIKRESVPVAQLDSSVASLSESERQLKEMDMITQAQTSGQSSDYQAYLDLFPNGIFLDLAQAEIISLLSNKSTPTPVVAPGQPIEAPKPEPAAPSLASITQSDLKIDTPLGDSIEHLGDAKSISELSQGSPLFPPFEGLDESYWKDQTCSNCHSWDQPTLCRQGTFYTTASEESVVRIKHPYGGFFKSALRVWAANSCE